jgi:hypothetical protein
LTQLELEKEADPYTIFVYSLRSPHTKESHFRRLRRFFNAISLEGPTFESRCNLFVDKAIKDQNWVFTNILRFLQFYKKRVDRKEITTGTMRNFYKTIKSFCEISDITIPWKKISRGLPRSIEGRSLLGIPNTMSLFIELLALPKLPKSVIPM